MVRVLEGEHTRIEFVIDAAGFSAVYGVSKNRKLFLGHDQWAIVRERFKNALMDAAPNVIVGDSDWTWILSLMEPIHCLYARRHEEAFELQVEDSDGRVVTRGHATAKEIQEWVRQLESWNIAGEPHAKNQEAGRAQADNHANDDDAGK